jgi:hypothetical protein
VSPFCSKYSSADGPCTSSSVAGMIAMIKQRSYPVKRL